MTARLLVLSLLLLTGCGASGPGIKSELAKPDGTYALVYLYRPNTVIGIINADVPFVHLDDRTLTRIRIGGYMPIRVAAGRHRLITTESLLGSDTGKIRGETTFTVPAGATIYLRYTESFRSVTPIVLPKLVLISSTGEYRFEAVPETEALSELANTSALQ